MNGYSQPAEYRFSHDSVELASRAARLVRMSTEGDVSHLRVLDLCAGCGVVGLELARQVSDQAVGQISIDFSEVQEVYRSHFDLNCEWIKSSTASGDSRIETTWLDGNYASLLTAEFEDRYDLVVSNPPYFDVTQGKLPPSDFKARCRFFVDSDFATLWKVIRHVLKPHGQALVLVRDLGDHGLDRRPILDRVLEGAGVWVEVEPIRGTGVVHFKSGS